MHESSSLITEKTTMFNAMKVAECHIDKKESNIGCMKFAF